MRNRIISVNTTEADKAIRLAQYHLSQMEAAFEKSKALAHDIELSRWLENPYQTTEDAICSKAEIKGMTLTNEAILSLQNININGLKDVVPNLELLENKDGEIVLKKNYKKDIIERFTRRTQTESENEILLAVEALVISIKSFSESYHGMQKRGLSDLTNGLAHYDVYNSDSIVIDALRLQAAALDLDSKKRTQEFAA